MRNPALNQAILEPQARDFYRQALHILTQSQVPFLVGGAYAFERYTGIARHTKDLDLFSRPEDCPRLLNALAEQGYQTEMAVPHWLGKATCGDHCVDIIFRSANGCLTMNDECLENAVEDVIFDVPVKLIAPEEMIASKAFVMARDRFDGADVAHLLRACADRLDWSYLLHRFGDSWRVLLSHLILFGFIYPGEQDQIPSTVMEQLLHQLHTETHHLPEKLCRGTLLAPLQYRTDVEKWHYQDARLRPWGNLSSVDIDRWIDHLHDEQGESGC